MRYAYPAIFTPEPEGGFSVTFPDVPEAITQGQDMENARFNARDALVAALSFYTEREEAIPEPSGPKDAMTVAVPILTAAKLELYRAKKEKGLSNVALGRILGEDEKGVRRLIDPLHKSHIGSVESALILLKREPEILPARELA